jgi:hypothetical protein
MTNDAIQKAVFSTAEDGTISTYLYDRERIVKHVKGK